MIASFCSVGDLVIDAYKKEGFATLGGTALYSSLTAKQLKLPTSIVSAVGNDIYAKKYVEVFKNHDIDISHLKIQNVTSSITVILDKDGKPDFLDWNLGALKYLKFNAEDIHFIQNHDIVRVALFKTFEHVFEQMHKIHIPHKLKIADFSGGSMYSNEKEILEKYINGFDIIAKSITETEFSDLSYYENLAKQTKKVVILTAGKKGSIVFSEGMRFDEPVKEVIDGNTTGAGDVYLTTFAIFYKQTENIMLSMQKATEQVRQFLKDQRFRYKLSL